LAVIVLIQNGGINENKIQLSDDLIAIFKKYIALTPGWNPTIYNPFYRLQNEGFWHLRRWRNTAPPTSVRQLQNVGAYAVLDDALFYFLRIPEYREIIRQTLIDRYFPELRQDIEYLTIEQEAEEYSEQLLQDTQHPFSIHRDVESIQVETPIRSAGFRRAIMQVYAYTCAVCALNIRALSGESVTDAAHIIPFSVSYNDDIRNGISLCKSHHWAFDTGLISVNEAYEVIVSPSMTEQGPTASMLTQLRNKRIWLPSGCEYRPAPEALAWHRQTVMRH
jgi:putative restriction endonuclease